MCMTDGEGVSSVMGKKKLLLLPSLILRSAMTTAGRQAFEMTTAFPAIPAPSIILMRRLVTIHVR